MKKSRLIVVLGMHRSGTSAITRGLQVFGVGLGDRLMPAIEDNNAKGFWEDIDLNALNIEMLSVIDSDWHHLAPITASDVEVLRSKGYFLRAAELLRQKSSNTAIFGFKDPRVTKLLPFWKKVFEHCQFDVNYVLAVRHPLSVVKSLAKRDGFDTEKSYLLWLGHVITGLLESKGNKRVLVDYDLLMQLPEHQLNRIVKCFDLALDSSDLQIYKTEFLDQELRHTLFAPNDLELDKSCPALVQEVYATLLDIATDEVQIDDAAIQKAIEQWNREFGRLNTTLRLVDRLQLQKTKAEQTALDYGNQIASLKQVVAERDGQIISLKQAVAERDGQITSLKQAVAERDGQITSLKQAVAERDGQITSLKQAVAERDGQITSFKQAVAERDGQITSLKQAVTERDGQIASLEQGVAERDEQIASLNQKVTERDNQLTNLHQAVAERNREIASLKQTVTERDEVIVNLNQTTVSYADALKTIEEIRASSCWQITLPIRYTSSKIRNIVSLFNLLPRIIRFGGGVRVSATKAGRVFSREGWSGVKRRILFVGGNRCAPPSSTIRPDLASAEIDRNDYSEWVRRYDTLTDIDRKKIKSKIAGFAAQPLISVIMPVYNPPISFLEEAIRSVRNQLYSNWELCIADDASTNPKVRKLLEQHRKQDSRIKVVYRKQNGHISRSSNSALELAQGEFVALFDHDDLLAEHALYCAVDVINRHPDVCLIYSDEDKIDESNLRYDPYFKCALNYELLLAQNMISHLGIYRTNIVRSLGGFRVGYEGSQDYDLVLRVIERLGPNQIIHIPHVLYHWRAIAGSTALAVSEKNYAVDASRKAVTEHLQRRGISAEVMPALEAPMFNRVRFTCPSPQPLVSIIIPTRDRADLLGMCIDSLVQRTTYSNYEVIIMDNGSVEDATRQLFDRLSNDRFRVLRDESPFNFSALNNNAARAARGELLCLMNNDIEILTPDWLEEMVSFAIHSDIGCVGARLWYPDGALQHGGVLLGIGGVANHAHYKIGRGNPGYFGRAVLHQSLSAVTGACLLVRRQVFEEVGGLDEQLAVAFNDIDFCLRVREAGYRNVWTPYAEMNHHESASRKNEDTPEKLIRFRNEVGFMQAGWGEILLDDPAYSPNLTLDDEHFSYAWPPRVSL